MNIWVVSATADSVTLSDGRVITSADIPGNGWNANRLEKMRLKLQDLIDVRTPEANFPPDEEYLTMTDAQLTETYGERVFRDGTDIVVRHTIVEAISYDETKQKLSLSLRNPRMRGAA